MGNTNYEFTNAHNLKKERKFIEEHKFMAWIGDVCPYYPYALCCVMQCMQYVHSTYLVDFDRHFTQTVIGIELLLQIKNYNVHVFAIFD